MICMFPGYLANHDRTHRHIFSLLRSRFTSYNKQKLSLTFTVEGVMVGAKIVYILPLHPNDGKHPMGTWDMVENGEKQEIIVLSHNQSYLLLLLLILQEVLTSLNKNKRTN